MEPVTASKAQKYAVALVRQQSYKIQTQVSMRMNDPNAAEMIDHNVEREICAA